MSEISLSSGREAMRREALEGEISRRLQRQGIHKVLLGLSGGADSVALLLLLLKAGVEVKAIHCNFGLRGEESERDMRFVEALCKESGVDLDIVRFDVYAYCREKHISVEMACRDLRYAEFRKIFSEGIYDRIAVAHHADDNIETMLLNLFRGSGMAGLRGMKEDTGEIIRPLLNIPRSEILKYLECRGRNYVTDSTNLDSDYLRNYIRNELLPSIEARWPGVRKSLQRTAGIISREEKALEEFDRRIASAYDITDDVRTIPNDDCSGDVTLQRRMELFLKAKRVAASVRNEILEKASNGRLRPGSRWKAQDGSIEVSASAVEWIPGDSTECAGEVTDLRESFEITAHILTPELLEKIKHDSNDVMWTGISPEAIIFRHPKPGDYISPLGMRGRKAVSDVVAESKITPSTKKRLSVVEWKDKGHILWVEGLKRSKYGLAKDFGELIWKIKRKH